MVEVSTSNRVIRNRCILGSNSSHTNSRPNGSSSIVDIFRYNSGDIRGTSSTSLGPAGRGHLPNSSTGTERLTSRDNNIGEEISRIGTSGACVNAAAMRRSSPQSAGLLETRPHQRRSTIHIRHHLQELTSRSTTPAPLPRGHRTNTAVDTRPRQVTGLHRHQSAMHLPRRCHHRQDVTDHLHRRLPRNPTGAFHPGTPRPSRHVMCRQASFRTWFRVSRVQTMTVSVLATFPRYLLGSR